MNREKQKAKAEATYRSMEDAPSHADVIRIMG
jgi:hypothetical protein